MGSLLLLALLATPDDAALEARLKKVQVGDLFTLAPQLPASPWKVRQALTATGKPECRGYAFLLEGDSQPWAVLAVFCGSKLVRTEGKAFVDWPIMANFGTCTVKLRLATVDALSPSADLFWLSETAVCDGDLLAEEFAWEAKEGRLTQQLKAVCADPAAGKTAVESYRADFEGKAYPKPFRCNQVRFDFKPGKGYQWNH